MLHQVELVAEPTSRAGQQVARGTCTLFAARGRPVRVSVAAQLAALEPAAPR